MSCRSCLFCLLFMSNCFSNITDPESAIIPQPLEVPCECKPGYGLQKDPDGYLQCLLCKQGTYGTGGEILNDFSYWNGSSGIPGSGYNMYLYCNDFLSTATCNPWRPEGVPCHFNHAAWSSSIFLLHLFCACLCGLSVMYLLCQRVCVFPEFSYLCIVKLGCSSLFNI